MCSRLKPTPLHRVTLLCFVTLFITLIAANQAATEQDPYGRKPAIFNSLYELNFEGDYDTSAIAHSKLFDTVNYPTSKLKLFSKVVFEGYEDEPQGVLRLKFSKGPYLDDTTYLIEFTPKLDRDFDLLTRKLIIHNKKLVLTSYHNLWTSSTKCMIDRLSLDLSGFIKEVSKTEGYSVELIEDGDIMVGIASKECGLDLKLKVYVTEPADKPSSYIWLILGFFFFTVGTQIVSCNSKALKYTLMVKQVYTTYIAITFLILSRHMIRNEDDSQSWISPILILICFIFEVGALASQIKAPRHRADPEVGIIVLALLAILLIVWGVQNYFFTSFLFHNSFLLLMSLYLIPLIIHNAITNTKITTSFSIILPLIQVSLLVPLYLRSYRPSFFNLTPSPSLCYFILTVTALQVIILYLQQKVHPQIIFRPMSTLKKVIKSYKKPEHNTLKMSV